VKTKAILQGAATIAAVMVTTTLAFAQVKPDDVIKFRKGAYQVISWHIKPLGAMVKGEQPYNKEAFIRNAVVVEQMSKIVPEAFVPGSDKGTTRAKPEIWSDGGKFKAALEQFQTDAAKMTEVSRSGNFDQIKVQFGALTKACDNCHDNFRSK
jgi:cytochrome c556